jgi:hypothetical protein
MSTMKKQYEKPSITYTQTLTTRATVCNKADDSCGAGSPIQS